MGGGRGGGTPAALIIFPTLGRWHQHVAHVGTFNRPLGEFSLDS